MHDGPQRHGGRRRLFAFPCLNLSFDAGRGDAALEGFRAGCDETRKARSGREIDAEHQPVERRILQREQDIGHPCGVALCPATGRGVDKPGHFPKALLRDGGEKLVLVPEMPVGRHMRDARVTRRRAQRRGLKPVAFEQIPRGDDQPGLEAPPIVRRLWREGRFRGHGSASFINVDAVNVAMYTA